MALYRLLRYIPFTRFLTRKMESYRRRAEDGVQSVRHISFRGGLLGVILSMVIWVSVFLYIAFYYTYMPSISHIRPLHMQFKSCGQQKGLCSFPTATVVLTKRQQLLMVGQPYKIMIELEMPESPANKELGMFMICAQLYSRNRRNVIDEVCRSTMLHYRSPLLEAISTLALSPFMVLGNTEEKQSISVELFSDFEEVQNNPVTEVEVEIQTHHIELYSATMLIRAHFTGLRYLMFHWPILSAAVGITTNLFFILLIFSLSWWRLSHSEDTEGQEYRYRKLSNDGTTNDKDDYEGNVDDSSASDLSLLEDSPNPKVLKSSSCPGSPVLLKKDLDVRRVPEIQKSLDQ